MIAAWFAALALVLGPTVIKALKFLGFSVITWAGLEVAVSTVISSMQTQFGGLTSEMLTMITMMQVDHAMTIILSAYLTVFSFKKASGFFKN